MFCKIVIAFFGLYFCALAHEEESVSRDPSLYEAIEKLLDHAKYDIQDTKIAVLLNELKGGRLDGAGNRQTPKNYASTYTRWGRRTCQKNSVLIYEWFAAGGHYSETGAAANTLCLPQNPDWNNQKNTPKYIGLIHGSEYETYESMFDHLTNHEVPCAVSRIPRSGIVMVPGKNVCFENYVKEYNGYLMTGYPKHAATSEYICVDGDAETANKSLAHNHDGKMFYFVRAKCGSLKCPPYKVNDDLTCVVCSYSPKR